MTNDPKLYRVTIRQVLYVLARDPVSTVDTALECAIEDEQVPPDTTVVEVNEAVDAVPQEHLTVYPWLGETVTNEDTALLFPDQDFTVAVCLARLTKG